MKNETIKLNSDISMDLLKFREGKMLLQANTGGGKSHAIRRIVEQAFNKIPIIILDTEGEFSSLRQKHDVILIGKGQEIGADHKSAAMLAHRLIKERVSAIIDLFEMTPYERETFVKNFVSAMTNAPKDLWLPTLLVIDEAQTYAPEGDKTECGRVLHDAAFKFRKRHFGIIFATPRIAVLSKNVSSTCRNKLIGYTSEPNDVKRAAYELGLTSKDEWRSLRDLDPGEFFVFGPAISKEVIKVKMGEVSTTHGDEGNVQTEIAPPSARVKKALAALADLPKEAEEEAKTIAEFKAQNAQLKRELTIAKSGRGSAPATKIERITVPVVGKRALEGMKLAEENAKKVIKAMKFYVAATDDAVAKLSAEIEKATRLSAMKSPTITMPPKKVEVIGLRAPVIRVPLKIESVDGQALTNPEQRVVDAIAWMMGIGINEPNKTAVAFLAGYTYGSGGFNNPCGSLRVKGYIRYMSGEKIVLTEQGYALANVPQESLTNEELHRKVIERLPGPEQRLLRPLIDAYPNDMADEELAEIARYTAGSGGFNNPKGRLRTLGLVEYTAPRRVRASQVLFPV